VILAGIRVNTRQEEGFSTDQKYTVTWALDLLSEVEVVVLVKNCTSNYFLKIVLAVETVEILCPEVNLRPPHKI
jgi:hypothetical protein